MLDDGSINDGTYDVDTTKPVSMEERDRNQPRETFGNTLTPIHSCIELTHGDYLSASIDHGSHG
jgi:hypothetical protein